MTPKKVLITGVYGLIAGAVYRRLSALPERYEVHALARRAEPSERATKERLDIPDDRFYIVDMADLDRVEEAFAGMDTIIHMAADPRPDASWDSLLQSNIVGARNAFEAAVRRGVGRVVYASSIMVSWGYQAEDPYKALSEGRFGELDPQQIPVVTHEWPTRPTGLYPASKVFGEALARYSADVHDLSSLCLRIGWVNAEDHPHRPEAGAVWCSQRDIVQLVEKAVEAPDDLKFGIFYGVSDNKWRWVDIDHTREVLGYIPQDSAEARLAAG
jgi:nucleoside-diphosphate-sugar epimerase